MVGNVGIEWDSGQAPSDCPPSVEAAVATATTSLACYLRKGSSTTRHWRLNDDNSYFKLNGEWKTTPNTKLANSSPTHSLGDYRESDKGLELNNLDGYDLVAIFALTAAAARVIPSS